MEINHIEAKEITVEIIDQIIEVDQEKIIDVMIDVIVTDKMIGKTIIDKTQTWDNYRNNYRSNYGRDNQQRYRNRSVCNGTITDI